jgi:predicted amidohydrolase
MIICVAQIKPIPGDLEKNIANHLEWVIRAIEQKVSFIIFPELSLTGYEPKLAHRLAFAPDDLRLQQFQELSDKHDIVIGLGMPKRSSQGIHISNTYFQAKRAIETYDKQLLPADEKPYFIGGDSQCILSIQNQKVAPAICYESLQVSHISAAHAIGAQIYCASVAKSSVGIQKAYAHFPRIAAQYSIPVLMSNCIGHCDNFESAGQSAIWNAKGQIIGSLDEISEDWLLYSTRDEKCVNV